MTLYSKYIARQLLHVTLLITVSLTSIVWLMQALRFIDFIVNQGVSIWLFLKLTSLLVPSLVLMVLPPAFLCAVIFTYHKLKSDSELVVMQSMGLDKWKLTLPAFRVSVLLVLLAYSISFYFQPLSVKAFKELQLFLRNNYVSILLQEGVFSSPVNGLTVFIRERQDDGVLKGILVQDARKEGSAITMMADRGILVQTPSGPRFLLEHGNRQEMTKGKLSFLSYDNYTLDISLYTTATRGPNRDVQELSLPQLIQYDATVSELENNKRRVEFHQRILWPAYIFTVLFMAMAFMLTGQFSRRSNWKRLTLTAVISGASLFSFAALKSTLIKSPDLYPMLYTLWLLPTGGALALLLKDPNPGKAAYA